LIILIIARIARAALAASLSWNIRIWLAL